MRERRSRAPPATLGAVIRVVALAAFTVIVTPAWAQNPGAAVTTDGETLLASRRLSVPVDGVAATALRDSFDDGRPGHRHEAIDIAAPKGTKVFAVDDGKLVKLFTSMPGGLTVYQFDPNGELAYYYAHLDRYADGLHEGMALHRCDLLGHVGTSGNAPPLTPHLHFAVFRLGPAHRWWKGTPLNPFPALTQPNSAARATTGSNPLATAPVSASRPDCR